VTDNRQIYSQIVISTTISLRISATISASCHPTIERQDEILSCLLPIVESVQPGEKSREQEQYILHESDSSVLWVRLYVLKSADLYLLSQQ
jgi:hypothetical protein